MGGRWGLIYEGLGIKGFDTLGLKICFNLFFEWLKWSITFKNDNLINYLLRKNFNGNFYPLVLK